MRSWWENQEILDQFRQWLARTDEEIDDLEDEVDDDLLDECDDVQGEDIRHEDAEREDAERERVEFERGQFVREHIGGEQRDNEQLERDETDDRLDEEAEDAKDEAEADDFAGSHDAAAGWPGTEEHASESAVSEPSGFEHAAEPAAGWEHRSNDAATVQSETAAVSMVKQPGPAPADLAAAASALTADEPLEPLADVGLLEVVEALTAMRHELKLQTKGTRGLESAVQTSCQALDSAIRQFQSVQAREKEAAARAAMPLAETLAGLDEALLRGAKAFEATHRQMTSSLPDRLNQSLGQQFLRLSAWRRWLLRGWLDVVQRQCSDELAAANADEFAKLMEGYVLIRRRLEQELKRHGVQRIETVGRRVDPTLMTVVELVDDPSLEPETVAEELRPGYLYGGKPLRFAEVRAVGSRAASPAASKAPFPQAGDLPSQASNESQTDNVST